MDINKNIMTDIELNELFEGKVRVFQKKQGYRFSIDSILLGWFAIKRAAGTVVDLGTGSGILPVVLARHEKFFEITGVEIQKDLAELAGKNLLYNDCTDRVKIVHADIKKISTCFSPESFDTVITNPPFYPAGSGRINPDRQSAIARHELHGTLRDFISAAAFLLRQAGKFIAVYTSSRIVDLIVEMRCKNIEPKTLQFVHSKTGSHAAMILVEGVKAAGTEAKTVPPMVLYNTDGSYTEQAEAVFREI